MKKLIIPVVVLLSLISCEKGTNYGPDNPPTTGTGYPTNGTFDIVPVYSFNTDNTNGINVGTSNQFATDLLISKSDLIANKLKVDFFDINNGTLLLQDSITPTIVPSNSVTTGTNTLYHRTEPNTIINGIYVGHIVSIWNYTIPNALRGKTVAGEYTYFTNYGNFKSNRFRCFIVRP